MAAHKDTSPPLVSVFLIVLIVFTAGSLLTQFVVKPQEVHAPVQDQQKELVQTAPTQAVTQSTVRSTVLSFSPASSADAPLVKRIGDVVTFDVMVDPGQNVVSFIKMDILYDQSKMAPTGATAFKANGAMPSVLESPVYTPGKISTTLSIGADPTKGIDKSAKAGSVTFKLLSATDAGAPAQISFSPATQILSLAPQDNASDNVLSSTQPAVVIINR